jgi:anaerobic selenocysteine-containing dehydrogenase
MDIERLRQLAEKTKKWTKADKEFMLPILAELGIEAPTKTSCTSCWRDAAILAVVKVNGNKAKTVNGFRLKGTAATRGVLWMGRLVSPSTLDADMVKWLIDTGFPRHQYELNDES